MYLDRRILFKSESQKLFEYLKVIFGGIFKIKVDEKIKLRIFVNKGKNQLKQ